MQGLRQLLSILLIPLYLYAGAFLSGWLSKIFGIWDVYANAVVLPSIGLIATYFIAPNYKVYKLLFIYIIDLVLAY